MNIDATSSLVSFMQGMQGMQGTQNNTASGCSSASTCGNEQTNGIDISHMGQRLSQMSDGDRAEMRDFRQQVMSAKESGEFDAEALAEIAPDFLKALAEEKGVDLTDMITKMSEGGGRRHEIMQGMGNNPTDLFSMFQSDEDQLSSLISALFKNDDE